MAGGCVGETTIHSPGRVRLVDRLHETANALYAPNEEQAPVDRNKVDYPWIVSDRMEVSRFSRDEHVCTN
jgi:hypothetical protein